MLNNSNNIMEKKAKSKASNSCPVWKAKTKGYKDCVLYCRKKYGEDFFQTNREFIDYIRTTHGLDTLRSMLEGDI